MPLWSFPATVLEVTGPATFSVELDLGCRLYHPAVIRVAGIRPRNTGRLRELLAPGTRVAAVTEHLAGGNKPVRAHVTLDDGRDLAAAVHGGTLPTSARPVATYGADWTRIWRYPAVIRHVIDGDTIAASINMGVPTHYVTSVRVEHVNCAEAGTPAGADDTAYATTELPTDTQVLITSRKLEKYGRVLGAVALPDGRDYGTNLINAGHAQPYEGAGPR